MKDDRNFSFLEVIVKVAAIVSNSSNFSCEMIVINNSIIFLCEDFITEKAILGIFPHLSHFLSFIVRDVGILDEKGNVIS